MKQIVWFFLVNVLWMFSSAVQAVTVSIDDSYMVKGDYRESIIRIGGLAEFGNSPHLGGFDLDISFDPNIITLYSVTFEDTRFNSRLGEPDFQVFTRSGATLVAGHPGLGEAQSIATLLEPGKVNLLETSLLSVNDPILDQQGASFILGVLRFGGSRPGFSSLNISINELSDELAISLLPNSTVDNGSITVVDIPEIEATSGTLAIGLLIGVLALLGEKRIRFP